MVLTGPISAPSKLLPEVKDLHYAIKVKALLLYCDHYVLSTWVCMLVNVFFGITLLIVVTFFVSFRYLEGERIQFSRAIFLTYF